ncbi:MAG: hypothetical protein ACYC91_08675 [Solirubrobacteraceae bacterium]
MRAAEATCAGSAFRVIGLGRGRGAMWIGAACAAAGLLFTVALPPSAHGAAIPRAVVAPLRPPGVSPPVDSTSPSLPCLSQRADGAQGSFNQGGNPSGSGQGQAGAAFACLGQVTGGTVPTVPITLASAIASATAQSQYEGNCTNPGFRPGSPPTVTPIPGVKAPVGVGLLSAGGAGSALAKVTGSCSFPASGPNSSCNGTGTGEGGSSSSSLANFNPLGLDPAGPAGSSASAAAAAAALATAAGECGKTATSQGCTGSGASAAPSQASGTGSGDLLNLHHPEDVGTASASSQAGALSGAVSSGGCGSSQGGASGTGQGVAGAAAAARLLELPINGGTLTGPEATALGEAAAASHASCSALPAPTFGPAPVGTVTPAPLPSGGTGGATAGGGGSAAASVDCNPPAFGRFCHGSGSGTASGTSLSQALLPGGAAPAGTASAGAQAGSVEQGSFTCGGSTPQSSCTFSGLSSTNSMASADPAGGQGSGTMKLGWSGGCGGFTSGFRITCSMGLSSLTGFSPPTCAYAPGSAARARTPRPPRARTS